MKLVKNANSRLGMLCWFCSTFAEGKSSDYKLCAKSGSSSSGSVSHSRVLLLPLAAHAAWSSPRDDLPACQNMQNLLAWAQGHAQVCAVSMCCVSSHWFEVMETTKQGLLEAKHAFVCFAGSGPQPTFSWGVNTGIRLRLLQLDFWAP